MIHSLAVHLAQSTLFAIAANVIDRTGITGSFIIHLEYAPDENTHCQGPASRCAVDPHPISLPQRRFSPRWSSNSV
jgi:hypothetical protein